VPEAPRELSAELDALETLLTRPELPPWPQRAEDLARLETARRRLERRFTLAVLGEFSSGKSYLLNALLGKTRYDDGRKIVGLLATDINPSTAAITELEYAPEESAVARYRSGREERIPLDRLSRFVAVGRSEPGGMHDATADDDAAPSFVTVRVDSPFLARGFVIADTPGLASLNPAHRRATLGYLPRTDAVLYLIDTQQPFTEGDAAFLGLIGAHVRTIFIVQTKIDLWRMREADGREAWEHARARIVERAARLAPNAEVFAVSAREFAAGTLDGDPGLRERSGFPALLSALDRSLEQRAQAARVVRTLEVIRELSGELSARLHRESALLACGEAELRARHDAEERGLIERERSLARERDEVARAGAEREAWIVAQGRALGNGIVRALGSAIDVADIERVRDRSRFHSLVDATVAGIFTSFASDVAGHVARALERAARERPALRVADLAALRLGGEPGVGAWSRDLAAGITSTIVLGAIGGPTVAFVHAVASGFASKPHGAYMKRELGGDLHARIFPDFEGELASYVTVLARDIASIYSDVAAGIERERAVARAEALEPIERALAPVDAAARAAHRGELSGAQERLAAIESETARLDATTRAASSAPPDDPAAVPMLPESAAFDEATYGRGLRPERYRVVILGALRRGKTSLINAIAETRLLQDESDREALFPIHVRYGETARGFTLEEGGVWREIALENAMAEAARTPILIEVPWKMPRQLVLVHAPAFDSGNPRAEEIAFAAARAASEVLALFSRQLSDRELALYGRVAELGKPMLFAHTIADNESPAERRDVVELAGRYVRERNIPAQRIFTVSALDYLEALQAGRAAAPWNELGALRQTLEAHSAEHMARLAERARRSAELAAIAATTNEAASTRPNLRRAIDRLFGR
jgi:hypothetical protein